MILFSRSRRLNILYKVFIVFVITIVGNLLGLLMWGKSDIMVGPVKTTVEITPSLNGRTDIDFGPLGIISFKSHKGPLAIIVSVKSLEPASAEKLVSQPEQLTQMRDQFPKQLNNAILWLIIKILLSGAFLSFFFAMIHFKKIKMGVTSAILGICLNGVVGLIAYKTYEPKNIESPTYHGLMRLAPSLVGTTKEISSNFNHYRDQMVQILGSASKLYNLTQNINDYSIDANATTILHVSDLHINPLGFDFIKQILKAYKVDAVIDTGDISDHGSTYEDPYLANIKDIKLPYLYIKGNHDSLHTVKMIKENKNAVVLGENNPEYKIKNLTITGLGDPRLTPDKDLKNLTSLDLYYKQYAEIIRSKLYDLLLIHDPTNANIFDGEINYILAGHIHKFKNITYKLGTTLLVEGSTGAGGLRTITNRSIPAPFEASLLYFDGVSRKLIAIDHITMSGLGSAGVTVTRILASEIKKG